MAAEEAAVAVEETLATVPEKGRKLPKILQRKRLQLSKYNWSRIIQG
jgi:hypothetical protein